ncbi:nuclear transport factor 2 family protein [Dokdonella sp.]|uniref:nuclear transport factor 2 family protein n=1 Tax=Dokdonella sp. TaxID=2291710 RepID=UPI002F401CED
MRADFRTTVAWLAAAFASATMDAGAADVRADLARATQAYDRATIAGDTAALERLFADDYVLVNSDASVENKQQAIADFRMPGFKIDPYVLAEPVRTAWHDGAVIGGVVHLHWTQDGKHQQRWIRIAHVWARRDGDWRLTSTQVTRVPR